MEADIKKFLGFQNTLKFRNNFLYFRLDRKNLKYKAAFKNAASNLLDKMKKTAKTMNTRATVPEM